MKNKLTYLYLIIGFFFTTNVFTQNKTYIIVLKDKQGASLEIENHFSSKALTKRHKENISFDKFDLPVSHKYIQELNTQNTVINASKWLNACLIKSSLDEKTIYEKYPFVKQVIPVIEKPEKAKPILTSGNRAANPSLYNYSYNQLETTKTASCLHDKGYKGQGVLIAVLDAGFPNMDSMIAFSTLRNEGRVIDTWDFQDNSPYVYHKSTHGTLVSSIIAAELDSTFIGSAPDADFAFYITEIAGVEINQEEYNLVLGLERADSIGTDIASISLGYRDFDTLQISYGYPGMDGQTTIASQGAKVARNKGIIVVASAGNSGSDGAGSIASPCDTDSILCIGAIHYDSTKATFSSEGPTFDGRIKPDIANVGDSCYFIGTNDTANSGNGTSFSCPLTSGLVACLKQAHPSRTNFDIMQAMRQGASQHLSPDNFLGHGVPNGCKSDSILRVMDSLASGIHDKILTFDFKVFPNPSSDNIQIESTHIINKITVMDLSGRVLKEILFNSYNSTREINVADLAKGKYLIISHDINNLTGKVLFTKM